MCDRDDDDESMLLCDGCDAGYHMGCLSPPLTSVPPGDWFCPPCADRKRKEARRWACSVCQPNGPYTMTFDEANECEDRHIAEAEEADGVDESTAEANAAVEPNGAASSPLRVNNRVGRVSAKDCVDEVERLVGGGVYTMESAIKVVASRTGMSQSYVRTLVTTGGNGEIGVAPHNVVHQTAASSASAAVDQLGGSVVEHDNVSNDKGEPQVR